MQANREEYVTLTDHKPHRMRRVHLHATGDKISASTQITEFVCFLLRVDKFLLWFLLFGWLIVWPLQQCQRRNFRRVVGIWSWDCLRDDIPSHHQEYYLIRIQGRAEI